jgi:hypothetical protein
MRTGHVHVERRSSPEEHDCHHWEREHQQVSPSKSINRPNSGLYVHQLFSRLKLSDLAYEGKDGID